MTQSEINIQKIENFNEILSQIQTSKQKAYAQVNTTLVELYWNIGKYISDEVQQKRWGRNTVKNLSLFIKEKEPNIKGFSDRNIWSMKQFYEAYPKNKELPSLMAVLSWTHNRRIISLKTLKEREFYLEVLDVDVKLPHENPSIGVLLCREKNDEVVKYALNRSVSPLIIADYETKLIPKKLLQDKLNEIYALLENKDD